MEIFHQTKIKTRSAAKNSPIIEVQEMYSDRFYHIMKGAVTLLQFLDLG